MPIDRYLCPEFEEESTQQTLISRVIKAHHKLLPEIDFFARLLFVINRAEFKIAIIDGIVEGAAMDPSQGWYTFNPDHSQDWALAEHRAYMLLPYAEYMHPTTPLISVEFHSRTYLGGDNGYFKLGDIIKTYFIRYDKGLPKDIKNADEDLLDPKLLRVILPKYPEGIAK